MRYSPVYLIGERAGVCTDLGQHCWHWRKKTKMKMRKTRRTRMKKKQTVHHASSEMLYRMVLHHCDHTYEKKGRSIQISHWHYIHCQCRSVLWQVAHSLPQYINISFNIPLLVLCWSLPVVSVPATAVTTTPLSPVRSLALSPGPLLHPCCLSPEVKVLKPRCLSFTSVSEASKPSVFTC